MDIALFISRFLYRNRYQLLFGSILVTILVAYFTQFIPKNYTVKTSIYTGIVSSTTISDGDNTTIQNINNTFDNLINLVTSQSTLENVSMKLLATNLIYGNKNKDNQYITAKHFNELQEIVPEEVKRLIDKNSVERSAENLKKLGKNSSNNFIYSLLNGGNPHYSYGALEKVEVKRVKNSDIVEISYTNDDPGITTNTVKLFNEELLKSYNDLRYSATNDVIAYFEQEVAKLKSALNSKEDELTGYNVKHNIINYGEQTKNIAGSFSNYEDRYEDALKRYNSSLDLLHTMEKQMDARTKLFYNNKDFLKALDDVTNINSKITEIEMFSSEEAIGRDENLKDYKKKLKSREDDIAKLSRNMDMLKYSKEGLAISDLADQWIQSLIENTKVQAELKVLDDRRHDFEAKYKHYSPIGTEIKRRERDINVTESSYLEMLHALNLAYLRKKNIQLTTASLNTVSDPAFPLSPNKSKRFIFIIAAFIGSLIFISLYKLLIELLDRTLRDGDRAKRLTGETPVGAFVGKGELTYRGYSKTWNRLAASNVSAKLARYINPQDTTFFNVASIDNKEGKTFVIRYIAEEFERLGLNVNVVHLDNDMIESSDYILSKDFKSIIPQKLIEESNLIIIEYPPILRNSIPHVLLQKASLTLLVANARRVWRKSDNDALSNLKDEMGDGIPLKLLLNNAGRYDVEDYTGDLPPARMHGLLNMRFMHIGLTSKKISIE